MKNQPLSAIDSAFNNQYKGLLEIQRNISQELENYKFDLSANEITSAVYERMMSFWYFNVENCKDLGRKVNTTSADFFTETFLFFLKTVLKQYGLKVLSEENIQIDKSNKKTIRPDISVWKEDKLIAVIELKVSDGWKGKTIIPHLDDRKKDIQQMYPNLFFGAISFWNCFGEGVKTDNSEYIGLFEFAKDNNHQPTGKTIEQIIERVTENKYT